MAKEQAVRGSRKRFQTTITNLDGSPQDPAVGTCFVRLEKVGAYNHDSPTRWYPCVSVGGPGVYGANILLEPWLTLGDWLARFKWTISGVEDTDVFEFILVRRDKPWVHTPEKRVIS